jgi:hypothetical protein
LHFPNWNLIFFVTIHRKNPPDGGSLREAFQGEEKECSAISAFARGESAFGMILGG